MSTFGNTTEETGTSPYLDNVVMVAKFTLSEAGTVTKLSYLLRNTATVGCYFKPVIYDNDGSGGAPSTKIWSGDPVAVAGSAAKGWVHSAALSQALAAGDWWLGLQGDVNAYGLHTYQAASGGSIYIADATYTDGVPNPIGAGGDTGSENPAVYATYTAAAAGKPYYYYAQQ